MAVCSDRSQGRPSSLGGVEQGASAESGLKEGSKQVHPPTPPAPRENLKNVCISSAGIMLVKTSGSMVGSYKICQKWQRGVSIHPGLAQLGCWGRWGRPREGPGIRALGCQSLACLFLLDPWSLTRKSFHLEIPLETRQPAKGWAGSVCPRLFVAQREACAMLR